MVRQCLQSGVTAALLEHGARYRFESVVYRLETADRTPASQNYALQTCAAVPGMGN